MPPMPDAATFLPLKPVVLHVLLSLAEGPRHGYAIIQTVRERTGGQLQVHTGPLYRHLRRLLDEGLIQELDQPPRDAADDARRGAYYRLSSLGRRVLTLELRRMRHLLDVGRELGVT